MKNILLDAGHGGADNGAEYAGVREADVTLKIMLECGKVLEHLLPDFNIQYIRVEDKSISLADRYFTIMDLQPDVFISIHCNASEDNPLTKFDEREYIDGFEVFYRDANDLPLAVSVARIMGRSELWRRNRGIKNDVEFLGKRLMVLNSLPVPSILIEVGFLSNDKEREMILKNLKGIAELIAHGIADYFLEMEKNANV